MTAEEITSGLNNAVARGESIESAVQSFIAAGYNPEEVHKAASGVNMGVAAAIQKPTPTSKTPTTTPEIKEEKPGFFSKLFKKKNKPAKEATPPAPTTPTTILKPEATPSTPATSQTPQTQPSAQKVKKKNKLLIILISIIAILGIGLLILILFGGAILDSLYG